MRHGPPLQILLFGKISEYVYCSDVMDRAVVILFHVVLGDCNRGTTVICPASITRTRKDISYVIRDIQFLYLHLSKSFLCNARNS
jgi:hypothetical protein